MHVTLPSTLAGDARKIKGVELNAIAEQADNVGSADGGFSALLNGCWLATVDRGPYPATRFVEVGGVVKPTWQHVLKGDLLAGIFFLRQVSLRDGDDYDFDVQCEGCRKSIQWTVKLSHLPLRMLPAESAERVRAGEPFEATVDGAKVLFDLQTMAQEEPVARLMKQQKRTRGTIVDVVAAQVRRVDGVAPGVKARWEWLANLSMGELFELQEQMAAVDCGVDTAVSVVCQNKQCCLEQEVNLPLGKHFFSPKRKRREVPEEDLDAEETPAPRGSGAVSSAASPASGGGASAPTSGGTSTGGAATPG